MEKKYQVFISSTYSDLKEEREQVIKAVLEMGHIPVGMEMFSAADEEQWKIIARTIDDVDYYVIIAAHRYGSEAPDGFSYTEKEFDYAVTKGIPILGFIIEDSAPWPKNKIEDDGSKQNKLALFKDKIKSRLIQFWNSKEDLYAKVAISIMKATVANPRIGWVKANEVSGPEVMKELTRLSSENAAMRIEIEKNKLLSDRKSNEIKNTVRILSNNKVQFSVRNSPEWDSARSFEKSLAHIFFYAAPNLIDENSSMGIAFNISYRIVGNSYYKEWPIGRTKISEMIADFVALDLVEPSKKRHAVKDQNIYWSLTTFGKQVLKAFRRIRLEEGLESIPDAEENV